MSHTVTLNGLVMDDATQTPAASGIVWCEADVEGWWSSPNVRTSQLDASPSGVTVARGAYGGRPLVLRGIAKGLGTSTALGDDFYLAARTLLDYADLVAAPGLLTVVEPDVSLQAYVRLADRVRGRRVGALQWYEFEVPLLAIDPYRYASTATSDTGLLLSGSATTVTDSTTNAGTAASRPTITIDGPATNPKVLNTTDGAKYVQANLVLGAGDTLIIDLAAKTATVASVSVLDDMDPASQWWVLRPGSNSLTYSRTAGASNSTAQIDFRAAYV